MDFVLFAILAATAIGSSVAMVAHRNPVYSALYMVVTFVTTAIMFLLLGAPFIAALQIIVYAGAIIVLFLFVVMFLNLKSGMLVERRRGPLLLALILAALVAGELVAVVVGGTSGGIGARTATSVTPLPVGFGSVESVGELLFTRYLVPFEITSLLLVVGMVGAVVLGRREGRGRDAPFEPAPTAGNEDDAASGRVEDEVVGAAAAPDGASGEYQG